MTAEELLERLKDIAEIERHPKLVVATMTEDGEREIINCQITLSVDGVGGTPICKEDSYVYTENGIEKVHYCQVGCITERVTPKSNILAPVPSYEEWKASEKYNKHLEEKIKIYERKDKQATETSIAYNELAKENEELKELLKKCREFFYENLYDTEFHFSCGLGSNIKMESCMRSLGKLRIKINQALGEDK